MLPVLYPCSPNDARNCAISLNAVSNDLGHSYQDHDQDDNDYVKEEVVMTMTICKREMMMMTMTMMKMVMTTFYLPRLVQTLFHSLDLQILESHFS